jgi:hypothetical protein
MNNVERMFPLGALATQVHTANRKWWTNIHTGEYPIKRNVGELLMLVNSELVEALEGDRKGLQDDKLPQYKMFDVELVDALIRLLDLFGAYNIPVDEIFEAKMNYNANRADHKIENRLKDGGKKY